MFKPVMVYWIILFAWVWLGGFKVFCTLVVAADIQPPTAVPSLVSSIRSDAPLDFCGESVPLKSPEIRERFEKEMMLSLWDRPQVILWLKRSTRYLPHIEQALAQHDLPHDLKYIAIAESALRPHAGSKRGAIGFWQFTAATGRKYGLTIDRYMDERRNIFTSTEAAAAYLKNLYQDLGSWTLAAAGYNMGEAGLMAEILEQGTNDYYKLYLPLETQRYLFRILSVKLILGDPGKYGFHLQETDFYPPLAFDRVEVACREEIPIRIVAQAAKTHFKRIKDLNPQLRGHYLAKGNHAILIPKDGANGFVNRYEEFERKFIATRKEKIYVVKKGDNLSTIADRFGIPLAALIIWNRIDLNRPIHPGDRLIIYREDASLE